jgi:hypothetical protein
MIFRVREILSIFILYCAVGASVESKIIICGVCRNVADVLHNTINSIEFLCSHFIDYQVFV